MEMTSVWRQFEALSPAAQRQVAEFIAFLSAKAKRAGASAGSDQPVRDDPFVGIWSDRDDLADSTEWVRRLRADEWGA